LYTSCPTVALAPSPRIPGANSLSLQVQQEAHIKHATQLEQQLMEGAYNKVLSSKSNVPDQSYLYFMDKLISTVRYVPTQ